MKNLICAGLLIFVITHTFSQGKVKLGRKTLNHGIPKDFTNRFFWPQTELFKFNINQLAGSFVFVENDTLVRGRRVVKSEPLVTTVQNGLLYHARVDKGFDARLQAFIFSASLAENQVVDLRITDLMYVFIDWKDVPIDSLVKMANMVKLKGKRYYVQGVLLTSLSEQYNSSISTSAAIVGSAFGANGKVYSENDIFIQDYRISLTLIDLDKLKFYTSSKNLNNDSKIPALQTSKATAMDLTLFKINEK